MPAFTLEKAQEMLDTWMGAEAAIATGQEYVIGGQRMTRANLAEVGDRVTYWRREVERLTKGRSGPRIQYGVPV